MAHGEVQVFTLVALRRRTLVVLVVNVVTWFLWASHGRVLTTARRPLSAVIWRTLILLLLLSLLLLLLLLLLRLLLSLLLMSLLQFLLLLLMTYMYFFVAVDISHCYRKAK